MKSLFAEHGPLIQSKRSATFFMSLHVVDKKKIIKEGPIHHLCRAMYALIAGALVKNVLVATKSWKQSLPALHMLQVVEEQAEIHRL